MVLSGGTMIHGLPKRPTTTGILPPQQPPTPPVPTPRPAPSAPPTTRPTAHTTTAQPPTVPLTFPPLSTTGTAVFLSQIALPPNPVVTYKQFGPVDGVRDPYAAVENVRRAIVLKRKEEEGILDSHLTVVRVDRTSVSIWVFVVGSASSSSTSLDSLHFEDMHAIRNGSFTPTSLYPCSPECAQHPTRGCPSCTTTIVDGPAAPKDISSLPSTCLLPRSGLRLPYAAFLDAVRDRLIDAVSQRRQSSRPIMKLGDGFVLVPPAKSSGGAWVGNWDQDEDENKLVHCHLHVSLLPTRVLIQPLFRKISLLPLPLTDTTPGAPVVLLPYGTPAYHIGPFVGTNAKQHRKAFQESLAGLGCRGWEAEGFVVCWITVRNGSTSAAQGQGPPSSSPSDERGLMAVWPRALCFLSASPTRLPLTTFPSIPSTFCPPVSPPRGPKDQPPNPAPATSTGSIPTSQPSSPTTPASRPGAPSHTPESLLGALKALTTDGNAVKYGLGYESVATEMSSYVDWVVKDRERKKEMERLAKEQEKSKKDSGRLVPPPAVVIPTPARGPPSAVSGPSRLALPQQQQQLRPPGSLTNPQGYYPSPPEFNSPTAALTENMRPGPGVEVSPQVTQQHLGESERSDTPGMHMNVDSMGPPPQTQMMTTPGFDMDMGMEDVTEDDFSFFDVAGEPSAPHANAQAEPILPISNQILHSADILPTTTELDSAHDINNASMDPHSTQYQSHSALPISPARTQSPSPLSESVSLPSPQSPATPTSDKPLIPPEFPYRMKEHVPDRYQPIPIPISSVLADLKYSTPGSKFCVPPLSAVVSSPDLRSVELPAVDPDDLSRLANEFIPSLLPVASSPSLPIRGLVVQLQIPGMAELENEREKRRAESRAVREVPARAGKFEVWHSKKFVHKFSTDTDPRVKHVKRLTGLKRRLEWSPYAYLRTEGDGDARGTWSNWTEFKDTLPAEHAKVLAEEDSTDGGEDDGADANAPSPDYRTEEETVVVGDAEEQDETEKNQSLAALFGGREVRTPPPQSGPPTPYGASLLQTLFHPHHIFPLASSQSSTPSPQQQQQQNAGPPPASMSVPTPVSPAANFGQSGDGGSLLEAAAAVITREVVENPVWADAYKATFGWVGSPALVRTTDIDDVVDTFRALSKVQATTTMQDLTFFGDVPCDSAAPKTVVAFNAPPSIAVAHSGTVWDIAAPSIRFWEKLGLSPLGGPKDVVAFALYEEEMTLPEQLPIITQWLSNIASVYQAKGFGNHYVGSTLTQYADGLVPFTWEQAKKTVSNLIDNLPSKAAHVVLYVISAPSVGLTTSKEFKQLSTVIANCYAAVDDFDGRAVFHFVPRSLIYQAKGFPQSRHVGLERFVSSVYDRLPRKVSRIVPRQIFKRQMLKTNRFIQSPAFTIARPPPTYSYLLVDWPPASSDAADRHCLLHVAYTLSSSREWLVMAVIDERGEGHDLRVRCLGPSDSDADLYDKVNSRVMAFALEFAARANVEWSVVIVRSGTMEESELIAWEKCIQREVTTQELPIHITIGCVEQDAPLTMLGRPWSTLSVMLPLHHAGTLAKAAIQDLSSTAYVLLPHQRVQLTGQNARWVGMDGLVANLDQDLSYPGVPSYSSVPRPPQFGLLSLASSYIIHSLPEQDPSASVEAGSAEYPSAVSSVQLHILRTGASPTSSFRKPLRTQLYDISKSYYDLAVLTRARWGITSFGPMPFHIAAVETMKMALTYSKES